MSYPSYLDKRLAELRAVHNADPDRCPVCTGAVDTTMTAPGAYLLAFQSAVVAGLSLPQAEDIATAAADRWAAPDPATRDNNHPWLEVDGPLAGRWFDHEYSADGSPRRYVNRDAR